MAVVITQPSPSFHLPSSLTLLFRPNLSAARSSFHPSSSSWNHGSGAKSFRGSLFQISLNHACARSFRVRRRASLHADSVYSIKCEKLEATDVLIVGGGIAGLATSLALKKVGINSIVLEKGKELRDGGAALSLWGNAWRGLDVLEVSEPLRNKFISLKSLDICSSGGRTLEHINFDDCVGAPHEVRGVQRRDLLLALSDKLSSEAVRFDSEIVRIQQNKSSTGEQICVELSNGDRFLAKVLVGCDGVGSMVAEWMGIPKPNYSGYRAYRGVAHYSDGHNFGDGIRMIWGKGVRAGTYPLTPKDVYWFTCFNSPPGNRMSDPKEHKINAKRMIEGWEFGVDTLIDNTPEERISCSDISDRWVLPAKTLRWGNEIMATLAGDAAHPMTPNLGQGACTSIEDAIVLARELSSSSIAVGDSSTSGGVDYSVAEALARYEKERTIRCLPLQVRSHLMGVVLQSPNDILCHLRDSILVKVATHKGDFLNHTLYDCGVLSMH